MTELVFEKKDEDILVGDISGMVFMKLVYDGPTACTSRFCVKFGRRDDKFGAKIISKLLNFPGKELGMLRELEALGPRSPINTARMFVGHVDQRTMTYLILMEDLRPMKLLHCVSNVSILAKARCVLDGLARLHAHYHDDHANISHFAGKVNNAINKVAYSSFLKKSWAVVQPWMEENGLDSKVFQPVMTEIVTQTPWVLDNMTKGTLTLTHGDCHSMNMLIAVDDEPFKGDGKRGSKETASRQAEARGSEGSILVEVCEVVDGDVDGDDSVSACGGDDEKISKLSFIDWQLAGLDHGERDVSNFLCSFLEIAQYATHHLSLLQHYHLQLNNHLKTKAGKELDAPDIHPWSECLRWYSAGVLVRSTVTVIAQAKFVRGDLARRIALFQQLGAAFKLLDSLSLIHFLEGDESQTLKTLAK